MHTGTSKDDSRVASDRYSSGPAVILVADPLGHRKFKQMEELARLLAERCTVVNYEVPFMVTPEAKRPTPDSGERHDELAAMLTEFFAASATGGYPHPGTRASRLSAPPTG